MDRGAGLDIVVHSAGGLVFRFYAEVEGGEFRWAVFHGTPDAGSNLASLRYLLELQQFLDRLPLGAPQTLKNAVTDGTGQIGHDLLPDSLCLRYLDRAEPRTHRNFIFRGRPLSRAPAFALQAAVAQMRGPLRPYLRTRGSLCTVPPRDSIYS